MQVWRRLFWFQPKALFSKPLSVCHSLLLLFSFSVFHFNIPRFFFHEPNFWVNFVVLFLWCPLSCPSPFFVPASFLPTSFLPSPSPIHLAFVFGRFALLFFLSWRYFFFLQGWLFLLVFSCWFWFGVLLTVVVPIFFSLGLFCSVSLSGVVWWTNSGEGWFFCHWTYKCQRGFSLRKERKNNKKQVKQRDAGVCSIKSEMRYPSFNGTPGVR